MLSVRFVASLRSEEEEGELQTKGRERALYTSSVPEPSATEFIPRIYSRRVRLPEYLVDPFCIYIFLFSEGLHHSAVTDIQRFFHLYSYGKHKQDCKLIMLIVLLVTRFRANAAEPVRTSAERTR